MDKKLKDKNLEQASGAVCVPACAIAKKLYKNCSKCCWIIVCLMFIAGIFCACSVRPDNKDVRLTILYTNDIHCSYENYPLIGAYKETLKCNEGNTILVDGGDFVQGNPAGAEDKGANIIRLMNAAGYDYAVPGNHDYDYDMDAFIENAGNADFEWISCNYPGKDKYENAFIHEPYKIIDVGTHRISLIGIECEKTADAYIEKVKKAIADAESDGADFIIAIGHTGKNAKEIIEKTAGIDVYLNAHDHVVNDAKESILYYRNTNGESIPVYETGTNFQYMGELVLDCKEKDICYDFELKTASDLESEMAESMPESAVKIRDKCKETVNKCNRIMEPYRVEIGSSECTLCVYDPVKFPQYVDCIEYNSTDFIADAFRAAGKTDIAFVNLDSVRVGVFPGKVTKLDIYNLYPWNSKIYTTTLSGQQIMDILDFNLRNCPKYTMCSPAVSGITFTVDTSVPWTENGGKRIKNVMIGQESIDVSREYSVTSSEYYLLTANKDIINKTADGCTCIGIDHEVIEAYIKNDLNGVIPESLYSEQAGSGRINCITQP